MCHKIFLAIGIGLFLLAAGLPAQDPAPAPAPRLPNVVVILADDLGYGELGCYGQEKIATPNLDRLATQGMRFTRHYAGAPVCAPSRCVLMSGRSLPHARIRGNKEFKPEGQHPMGGDVVTVAELMRSRGYATGGMGKWGLGPPGTDSDPVGQGFDLFFGYNCQRQAHNFYPEHLWLNREKFPLDNPSFRPHQKLAEAPEDWSRFRGNQYAPDLMIEAALGFVRRHADRPFFLYLPLVEPHLAMQPPQSWVDRYPKEWDEAPYLGGRGYLHPRPRAGYAAMISHLDDHVGRVVGLIDELGLGPDTLVLFTSDNGPTHDVGGVDTTFFRSAGDLRGRKGSVYEGGLRVPTIARWTGRVAPGTVTDHVSGFQDLMPTLGELCGYEVPAGGQGLSYLPTLLGRKEQPKHAFLHWEFPEYGGQIAVIEGRWKAIWAGLKTKRPKAVQLYDLETDPAESTNVADAHPDIVARLKTIAREDREPNEVFPVPLPE
ncbi:MAG: arylsulfatase [Planctomycetota bacterium]